MGFALSLHTTGRIHGVFSIFDFVFEMWLVVADGWMDGWRDLCACCLGDIDFLWSAFCATLGYIERYDCACEYGLFSSRFLFSGLLCAAVTLGDDDMFDETNYCMINVSWYNDETW